MLLRALAIWFVLMFVAIANGAARELWINPAVGKGAGHVLSSLILSGLIVLVSWLTIGWMRPTDRSQAIQIGLCWLLLVLCFEFGAGHFVSGKTWSELLADYNVAAGRIWVVVPITVLLAPIFSARLRRIP